MKGIYCLVIHLDQDITINVGALGKTSFRKGQYVYVGSAQSNLIQRVKRHLRKDKRLFWHIDYLLDNSAASVSVIFYLAGDKAAECMVAKEINKNSGAVPYFGCSDCKCISHLFFVTDCSFLKKFMEPLCLEPCG